MFGIGKKAPPPRVGAREKRRLAEQIKSGGGAAVMSKREGKETSPAVSVIAIYIASLVVAWMVSQKYISQGGGLGFRLGWDELDRILFKTASITVTGTQELDYALLVAIRALALMVAAGIVPFVALVVQKSLDAANMNPFRTFWGTPIGILLVIIGVKEYLGPLLGEVLSVISG
jgi:hypothetical protein